MISHKIVLPKPSVKGSGQWLLTADGKTQQVYHGSFDTGDPTPVFKVRPPDPDRCTHGEDKEAPRISCATNLLDVIAGGYFWSPSNRDMLSTELRTPLNVSGLTANSVMMPSLSQVPDAGITGEVWVTDDGDLQQELCAVVKVTNHYTLQDLMGTERSGWDYLILDLEIEVLTRLQYDRHTLLLPGKYVVSIIRRIDPAFMWSTAINKLATHLVNFVTVSPFMTKCLFLTDTLFDLALDDQLDQTTHDSPITTETNFLVDLGKFYSFTLGAVVAMEKESVKYALGLPSFKKFILEACRGKTPYKYRRIELNGKTYYVLSVVTETISEREIPKWVPGEDSLTFLSKGAVRSSS